jgi:hypothetical protein
MRIKNEVCKNLDDIIRQFRRDLLAVSDYRRQSEIRDQIKWETTLEFSKTELEDLRRLIDGLIQQAESHPVSSEREEIKSVFDSFFNLNEIQNLDEEELEKEFKARKDLNENLAKVLSKEGLPEILSHIDERGKDSLPSKRIDGEGEWWAQVASRVLVENDLASKDEDVAGDAQYEITEKGRVVLECWEELQQTDTIQIKSDLQPESSMREIVLETLAAHFPENYSQ